MVVGSWKTTFRKIGKGLFRGELLNIGVNFQNFQSSTNPPVFFISDGSMLHNSISFLKTILNQHPTISHLASSPTRLTTMEGLGIMTLWSMTTST